jgi:hypothetical protein
MFGFRSHSVTWKIFCTNEALRSATKQFGFEEITKLSLKSWLFADIGGEVTHCNAAFLKPPFVSRLVAWQIDPGHLTLFLEERGS